MYARVFSRGECVCEGVFSWCVCMYYVTLWEVSSPLNSVNVTVVSFICSDHLETSVSGYSLSQGEMTLVVFPIHPMKPHE